MRIDMSVSPAFLEELNSSEENLEFYRNQMGLYKKSGYNDLESWKTLASLSDITKLCLLPLDITTSTGKCLVTNEQVASLVEMEPEFLIGFASVDPYQEKAVQDLEKAFVEYNLSGLYLEPARQYFYPMDEKVLPLYDLCIKYNKPIVFHSGMSPMPNTLSKYSYPLLFEEVAVTYPELRICLSQFGWPWVKETSMLLLKHKNIYTDTAMMYFDTAPEFYHQTFEVDLGPHWIDRAFRHQVMFGSKLGRLEQRRMSKAINEMNWRDSTKDRVFYENAEVFLTGKKDEGLYE